jgi:pimeloyl-ACP methyl ester carboxylesterase
VTLALAALSQKRRSRGRPPLTPQDASLRDAALGRFDRRMAVGVFRDVAHHPAPVAAPVVPSTIVLSDDAPAVLPDATAARLAALGWDVRRLPGVGHDFWLEDADGTMAAVSDLLVVERT